MGARRAVRSLNQTLGTWNYAGCEKTLSLTLCSSEFVIPSEARDLQFAANCRSLASLGMTIYERYRPRNGSGSDLHHSYSPPKNFRMRSSALSRFSIEVAYEKRTCSVVPKPSPATVATCAWCSNPCAMSAPDFIPLLPPFLSKNAETLGYA